MGTSWPRGHKYESPLCPQRPQSGLDAGWYSYAAHELRSSMHARDALQDLKVRSE